MLAAALLNALAPGSFASVNVVDHDCLADGDGNLPAARLRVWLLD